MAKDSDQGFDVWDKAGEQVGTGPFPSKRAPMTKEQEQRFAETMVGILPVVGGALVGRAAGRRVGKWATSDGVTTDLAKATLGTTGMLLGGLAGAAAVPRKGNPGKKRK